MESQYFLKRKSLILDANDSRYILKIRDLPREEKPREKLASHGPQSLSVHELLAIVLGTGTKKEEVLAMSKRILKEYGQRSLFSQKSVENLSRDLSIPLGKASQIVACGELARRFFSHDQVTAPVIRTAKDVFKHTTDMHDLSKEYLRGLYLNSHYKVIHDEVISIE